MDEQLSVLGLHALTKALLYSFNPHSVMNFHVSQSSVMTLQLYPLVNVRPVFFILNLSKHLFHGRQLFKLHNCKPIKGPLGLRKSLNCSHCTQLILLNDLAWVASDLSNSWKKAQPSRAMESCHFLTYAFIFALSAGLTLESSAMAIG